jgi:hypothetical protein
MRISFDLDETLTTSRLADAESGQTWWGWFFFQEPLRCGTRNLLNNLRSQGHEVWVYTSSVRSVTTIRWWFASYGITLDGIVNERLSRPALKAAAQAGFLSSKYPPYFGIDIHIDDDSNLIRDLQGTSCIPILVDRNDLQWIAVLMGKMGPVLKKKV